MEESEQQRLNDEDEKRGQEIQWRIPIAIQEIIYGQQVGVKRAAKGENFRETEDKQTFEDMVEQELQRTDEYLEIQKRLQPLFEEEASKRDAADRKRAAKDEKWKLEMESKMERGDARKWPVPRAWQPELTAEEKKFRSAITKTVWMKRHKTKNNARRRARRFEKSKSKMEVKQSVLLPSCFWTFRETTASPSQLPTTEVPPVGALNQPSGLASMDIKFILNDR